MVISPIPGCGPVVILVNAIATHFFIVGLPASSSSSSSEAEDTYEDAGYAKGDGDVTKITANLVR